MYVLLQIKPNSFISVDVLKSSSLKCRSLSEGKLENQSHEIKWLISLSAALLK